MEESSSNDQSELSNDGPSVSIQVYDTWDPDNNELDKKGTSSGFPLKNLKISK
jgi:hypothetical protein